MTGLSEGVPLYPVYKHLAASLYKAISSEALPRTENKLVVMQETSYLKQKEEEWSSLIKEKGSHLLNVSYACIGVSSFCFSFSYIIPKLMYVGCC